MKNNTMVRVFLLVLAVVMVFTFASCASNKDLEAAKNELADKITNLENNAKEESDKNAASLKEVKDLLDAVKATADAAATKVALDDAIADLAELVETTAADKLAAEQALAAAKQELAEAIEDGDDATLVAAQAAVTAAQNALNETIAANKAAAAKALADAVEALEKADTDAAKALADAVAALEGADDAIEAVLNKAVEDLGKVSDEIDADIAIAKAELQNKIDELAAKVGANEADIAGLKSTVEALQNAVSAIDTEKFAREYALATEMLAGKEVTVGETTYPAGKYSYAAFETAMELDPAKYGDLTEYKAQANYWYFMLGRATTVAEVISYFEQLTEAQNALLTLEQSLRNELDKFKGINAEGTLFVNAATDLTTIKAYYNQMVTNGTDFTSTEALKALANDYAALVAADDNFKAAVANAEAGIIAEISAVAADMVIYQEYAAIEAARATYTAFANNYFSVVANNKFYTDGDIAVVAQGVVTNYAALVTLENRVVELEAAYANIVSVDTTEDEIDNIDAYYLFATVTPLYTQAADLAAKEAAINAWIGEYKLEAANVARMYKAKYNDATVPARVTAAAAYAKAMNELFVAHNVNNAEAADSMTALVNAFVAQHNTTYGTYYAQYADAQTLDERFTALENAINAAAGNYAAIDGNYAAMAGEIEAAYAPVLARMAELKAADEAVKAIVELMAAMKGEVTYGSMNRTTPNIEGFRADLDAIYSAKAIAEEAENDNDNYDLIAAAAEALYDELIVEYNALTAEAAKVYAKTKWLMAEMISEGLLLKKGNEIDAIVKQLVYVINDIGVDNATQPLAVQKILSIDGDNIVYADEYEDVVLQDLYTEFYALSAEFKAFAKEAEAAAATVNDLIQALANKSTSNLNNRAEILAAYDAIVAWMTEYLPANTADEVAAVQAIAIFGENGNYKFVTTANYNTIMANKAASDAAFKAAGDKAENLIDRMNALLLVEGQRAWTIHSDDFMAIVAEFVEYVNLYYGQNVTEATLFATVDALLAGNADYDFFDELDVLAGDFEVEYVAYVAAKAQAATDAAKIVNEIKTLMDQYKGAIAMNDGAAALIKAQAIQAKVEVFYATYCKDDCLFTVEGTNYALELERLAARAEVAAKYAEKYATLTDDAVKAKMDEAMIIANLSLDAAKTYDKIDNALSFALSQIDSFVDPNGGTLI